MKTPLDKVTYSLIFSHDIHEGFNFTKDELIVDIYDVEDNENAFHD